MSKELDEAIKEATTSFEQCLPFTLSYNPSFDYLTKSYKQFKSWQSAIVFAQHYKLHHYKVVKVDDHYEIH